MTKSEAKEGKAKMLEESGNIYVFRGITPDQFKREKEKLPEPLKVYDEWIETYEDLRWLVLRQYTKTHL